MLLFYVLWGRHHALLNHPEDLTASGLGEEEPR